jgi:hypothetical protein
MVDDMFPDHIKQNGTFDTEVRTRNRAIRRAKTEVDRQQKRKLKHRDRYSAKTEMKVGRYMLPYRAQLKTHARRLREEELKKQKPRVKPKSPEFDAPKSKRHKKETKPPAKPESKPKPDLSEPQKAKRHKADTPAAIEPPPKETEVEKKQGTKRKRKDKFEFDVDQVVWSPNFNSALVVIKRRQVSGVNNYWVTLPGGQESVMTEETLSATKKPKKATKSGVKVTNPLSARARAKKQSDPKATTAAKARHRARTKSPSKRKKKPGARARTRSPTRTEASKRDESPARKDKKGDGGYVFNPFY